MASTVPKLKSDEVRAVFESLHDNKPPPPGLKFKILPVGSDGHRLSPPAHEFEDGVYVLLRPDKSGKKKKKGVSQENYEKPKIPPHLVHLKMETPLSKNCPWSLSGPQFPRPTAIQQRYCYPHGDDAYASQKGGAVWTMYNYEGKEDEKYRLLHVYYSFKRASNRTSTSAKSKVLSNTSKTSNKKKPNRKRSTVNVGKSKKKQKTSISKLDRYSMLPEALPPPSLHATKNQIFRQPHMKVLPNTASTTPGLIHHDLSQHDSYMDSFDCHKIYPVPSILHNNDHLVFQSNQTLHYHIFENDYPEMDQAQRLQVQSPPDLAREFDTMLGVPLADPSSMMNEQNLEWPGLCSSADNKHMTSHLRQNIDEYIESLIQKLNIVHKKIIYEWIGSRPRSERGRLVSVVANWARCISQSPLDICTSCEGDSEQGDHTIETGRQNVPLKIEDRDLAVAV